MKNCIQIVREVATLCGIQPPNAAVSSTDLQVRQLLAILNEEGRELAGRYDWQALTREATFVTVATASQGTIPGTIISQAANPDRIINDTIWNRSTRMPVFGPNSPPDWQQRMAMTYTSPYSEYRIRGNELLFNPIPAAGHSCAFEYITKNWVRNQSGDQFREGFEEDEDVPLLAWEILAAGTRWRWKKSKGLSYQEDFNTYERLVATATTRDGTKPILSLHGHVHSTITPAVTIPSGSWNIP